MTFPQVEKTTSYSPIQDEEKMESTGQGSWNECQAVANNIVKTVSDNITKIILNDIENLESVRCEIGKAMAQGGTKIVYYSYYDHASGAMRHGGQVSQKQIVDIFEMSHDLGDKEIKHLTTIGLSLIKQLKLALGHPFDVYGEYECYKLNHTMYTNYRVIIRWGGSSCTLI